MVTPAWPSQPWYSSLLEMSIRDPILLPMSPEVLMSPMKETHPLIMNNSLQLVGWVVSGDQSLQWDYQIKLRSSCSSLGAREQTSSYDSAWKKWSGWCLEQSLDPFSAPLNAVLDFLSWMFYEGFQYRTINVHRSAISSILPHINNEPVGQNHLVKTLMKGILRGNPPLPKHHEIWDVDIVLNYLCSLPKNEDLDLKTLSKKLAVLLAIISPKRTSEIARLDRRYMKFNTEGVLFTLPGLSKTQTDCTPRQVLYSHFPDNEKLCVVRCLKEYLKRTQSFREENGDSDPLLRTTIKPHKGLSPNTVANWIKDILCLSGIDTSKFTAHSTRGASTSKAAQKGIAIDTILDMADWSNVRTFKKFYQKPITGSSYGLAVLTGKLSSIYQLFIYCI